MSELTRAFSRAKDAMRLLELAAGDAIEARRKKDRHAAYLLGALWCCMNGLRSTLKFLEEKIADAEGKASK